MPRQSCCIRKHQSLGAHQMATWCAPDVNVIWYAPKRALLQTEIHHKIENFWQREGNPRIQFFKLGRVSTEIEHPYS